MRRSPARLSGSITRSPLQPVPTSMPGVGVRTAAWLLTEVTGQSFASVGHFASYAGRAPVTRSSGSSIRGEHASSRGNKILNRTSFPTAFTAPRAPVSRSHYGRKRSHGKRDNQALIALARRCCNVLCAVLRDDTIYQLPLAT